LAAKRYATVELPSAGAYRLAARRQYLVIIVSIVDVDAGWSAGRLYNGVRLPSARTVSMRVLSTSRVTSDDTFSHMLMQWGQFVDHDVDFVPTAVAHARFSDGRHCNETCDASGPCFPIPVSSDDPRVRRRRCIGFVRSSAMCGR